jgi:hypothetical protein
MSRPRCVGAVGQRGFYYFLKESYMPKKRKSDLSLETVNKALLAANIQLRSMVEALIDHDTSSDERNQIANFFEDPEYQDFLNNIENVLKVLIDD